MRHTLRSDQRGKEVWRGLDGESYDRSVALLSAYLALLHARGDWSDVSARERLRRLKMKKPRRYSRTLAHGFGLALRRDLSRNERHRLNGVARWSRHRDLNARG